MTTTPARFLIPRPEDSDAPDGPSDFNAAMDVVDARLGYAGAQGGESIVAGAQSPVGASYDWLGTPDRVQNLVIENDGDLLLIYFSALAKQSSGSGGAAIFIGANQLKKLDPATAAPVVQEAALDNSMTSYRAIYTSPTAGGLALEALTVGADHTLVTTGLGIPGAGIFVAHRLAAGTYDVGVKFKGTGLSAKERRLSVWTKEFPLTGI